MDGILRIDKPTDWTSHDIVAKIRGVIRQKKVGHTGTLDPMATGLLTLVLGKATRLVPYLESWDKTYRFTLRLGVRTDSHDRVGEVTSESPVDVTREQLESVIETFRGDQEQVPPIFSAIKIDGEALYKKARRGEDVAPPPPKPVCVHDIELESFSSPDAVIRVHTSKGFYVRSLARDIGDALGCGGTVWDLRRLSMGPLSLEGALEMEDITLERTEAALQSMGEALIDHPEAVLTADGVFRVRNGQQVLNTAVQARTDNRVPGTMIRLYGPDRAFLGVGEVAGSAINPRKVLI